MIIKTDTKEYKVDRLDFKAYYTDKIFNEIPWEMGLTQYDNWINIKVMDSKVIAIQCYTGNVYVLNEMFDKLEN